MRISVVQGFATWNVENVRRPRTLDTRGRVADAVFKVASVFPMKGMLIGVPQEGLRSRFRNSCHKLPSHSALCRIAFSENLATHLSDQGQIICIYARRDDVASNK